YPASLRALGRRADFPAMRPSRSCAHLGTVGITSRLPIVRRLAEVQRPLPVFVENTGIEPFLQGDGSGLDVPGRAQALTILAERRAILGQDQCDVLVTGLRNQLHV